MADKDYKIQISTTADTKGLDDATKAIDRTTDATEKATEATKELTDAEKEREERRQAYEQRRTENRSAGTSFTANPMTDGSQLRAARTELEGLTRATEEHAEAVQDVAEAEDDVAAALDRERQAQEDVAEARRRVRDRELEQIERNRAEEIRAAEVAKGNLVLKAAAVTMVAQTWHTATSEVIKHIAELRKLSPEAARQFEVVEAAAKFVQNPINAIFDEITAGTKRAIEGAIAAEKRAKDMKRAFEEAAAARKKQTDEATRNTLAGVLSRELAVINEATAAFERQLRVKRAMLDAEEALAKLADEQALAAGADPAAIAAGAERRRQTRQSFESRSNVDAAEAALQAAKATEDALASALASIASTLGPTSEDAKKARENLDKAVSQREAAEQDLEAVQQIANAEKLSLLAASASFVQGQQQDVASSIAGQVQAALDAIKAQADEAGGEMQGRTKQIFDRLTEILEDGFPDEQQLPEIQARIQAFKNTQEGSNREVIETLNASLETMNVVRSQMQGFRAELNQIQTSIKNLQQNIDARN